MLKTSVLHIAEHISGIVARLSNKTTQASKKNILVSGGGALNKHLIECLKSTMAAMVPQVEVLLADRDTTEFKEALVFAFLALRCLLGETNVGRQVTGSRSDSVSGSIHFPPAAIADKHPLQKFVQ